MAGKISSLLFITGIALIGYSIISGGANAGIFIIFPFVYGNSIFLLLGMMFTFIAMLIFPFEFSYENREDFVMEERKTRAGGIIMIGPFPIIITNDESIGKILIYIAIVIIAVMVAISIYSFLLLQQ